jgi:hypothetical protein
LRALIPFLLLLAAPAMVADESSPAPQIPEDVALIISSHESVVEARKQQCRREIEDELSALVAGLKELEVELTQQMQFEQALEVRKQALPFVATVTLEERCSAVADAAAMEQEPRVAALLAPVEGRFAEFRQARDMEIRGFVDAHRALLQQRLESYAEAGDLDACLAIRGILKQLDATSASEETSDAEGSAYSQPDVEMLDERGIQLERIAIRQQMLSEMREIMGRLSSGIRGIRSSRRRSQEIAFVAKLERERDVEKQVKLAAEWRNILSSSGIRLVDVALVDADHAVNKADARRQQFDLVLLDVETKRFFAAVAELRTREAFAAYSRMLLLNSTAKRILLTPALPAELPELPEQLYHIFEEFDSSGRTSDTQFLRQLDVGREILSERLTGELQKLPLSDKKGRAVLEHVLEYIGLDVCDTLEGMRLLPLVGELPEAIEASKFVIAAEHLLNQRHSARLSRLKHLRASVSQPLMALAEAQDVDACVSVLVNLRWMEQRFTPVPVLAASVPWNTRTGEGWVLDAIGDAVLIRFGEQSQAVWHPRVLVRAPGEKDTTLSASSGLGQDWQRRLEYRPGVTVAGSSQLAAKLRVFAWQGRRWELATLLNSSPRKATVRWVDSPQMDPITVEWSDLCVPQY